MASEHCQSFLIAMFNCFMTTPNECIYPFSGLHDCLRQIMMVVLLKKEYIDRDFLLA